MEAVTGDRDDAEVVLDIAGAIEDRYRALVLLAGFGGLRLGELLALRRSDVDLVTAVVRVEVQAVELRTGRPHRHAAEE